MQQPSKITTVLKQKASKVISAIVPKKKKKTLTRDTLSMSSTESITLHTKQNGDENSSSQPTVVDVSDREVEKAEEDPEVELGKVMSITY